MEVEVISKLMWSLWIGLNLVSVAVMADPREKLSKGTGSASSVESTSAESASNREGVEQNCFWSYRPSFYYFPRFYSAPAYYDFIPYAAPRCYSQSWWGYPRIYYPAPNYCQRNFYPCGPYRADFYFETY